MDAPLLESRAARYAAGKARRAAVPRTSHARWAPAAGRADPVDLVLASSAGRVVDLLPIRYDRMARSPFAFYRGTASVMAADLAGTPVSGFTVQLCGDAHCANFGGFATPEGNAIFDVNDFDETLPGPWEWDVKRLGASLVLAARVNALRDGDGAAAVRASVASYRARMQSYAAQTALRVWADRIDAQAVVAIADAVAAKKRRLKQPATDPRSVQHRYFTFTHVEHGTRRIVDERPLVYHVPPSSAAGYIDVAALLERYRDGLRDDTRRLVEQYTLADWVMKVVGIGSVGTRCAAALLLADDDDPLILQVKEANASVLEAHLGPSPFDNHGQRVVAGQRLMQSASDAFLGWAGDAEHCYYVRQLRTIRGAPDLASLDALQLREYGAACGAALANAHARTGDRAGIAGYLGRATTFDTAIATFSIIYADQATEDFKRFTAARDAGRLDYVTANDAGS